MAPELIFINSKYDAKKADVWSCGETPFKRLVAGFMTLHSCIANGMGRQAS
jgi:hypothetical protein